MVTHAHTHNTHTSVSHSNESVFQSVDYIEIPLPPVCNLHCLWPMWRWSSLNLIWLICMHSWQELSKLRHIILTLCQVWNDQLEGPTWCLIGKVYLTHVACCIVSSSSSFFSLFFTFSFSSRSMDVMRFNLKTFFFFNCDTVQPAAHRSCNWVFGCTEKTMNGLLSNSE